MRRVFIEFLPANFSVALWLDLYLCSLYEPSQPDDRPLTAARLKRPMRVSTYSQKFHAEHHSINAGSPVSATSPEMHD